MKLTNIKGVEIPMIGLGTFPFQGRVMADMVLNASKLAIGSSIQLMTTEANQESV